MRLAEKVSCAQTSRWLRSSERADEQGAFAPFDRWPSGMFATMQTLRTADGHFSDLPEFPYPA
jgi:hypothetical protein